MLLNSSQQNEQFRNVVGTSGTRYIQGNKKITRNNAATVSTSSAVVGRNGIGKHDPLTKLYDNAVLKIPKVIPSDSDSLYSECNNYNGSNNGKSFLHALNSLDSKKHRMLLTNNGNTGGKNISSKASRRQKRKMFGGEFVNGQHNTRMGDNGRINANGGTGTHESSFDTEDHDNSYESIKCDSNITNDETVDAAADSEVGDQTDVSLSLIHI